MGASGDQVIKRKLWHKSISQRAQWTRGPSLYHFLSVPGHVYGTDMLSNLAETPHWLPDPWNEDYCLLTLSQRFSLVSPNKPPSPKYSESQLVGHIPQMLGRVL